MGSKVLSENEERTRETANLDYFLSLANSRASLTALPGMAVVTAALLGLCMIPVTSMVFFSGHHLDLLPLFHAQLWAIGFSILVGVLSAFKSWVFRFQVFASSLSVLFALIGWVYALCFLALGIASFVNDPAYFGGAMVSRDRLTLLSAVGCLYVCGAVCVHVLLLRKRLREGHSAKRTLGNLVAASSVYSSKSVWIIFGAAVIVPNVLTEGEYVMLTFGILGFLLFASVTTSLPVEFAYLTYLKSRDRKYWEERPPKEVIEKAGVVRGLKKFGKWALIVIGAIVVIGILNDVLPQILG